MNIRLDSVHITRTYSGSMEGVPNAQSKVDEATKYLRQTWGDVPALILPYKVKQVGTKMGGLPVYMLPEWRIITLLMGPELSPEDHGSQLVVVWFAEEPKFEILPLLKQFKWEEHAKGFQY